MAAKWRRAGVGDLSAIHALREAFCAEAEQHWDDATDRAVLATLLEQPELGRAWLLEDGGVAAGYVVAGFGFSLEFRGRDAFVDELFIATPWRGAGHGVTALQLVAETCRREGIRALHLECDFDNVRAHDIYVRTGFVDNGRRLMTWWIGDKSL